MPVIKQKNKLQMKKTRQRKITQEKPQQRQQNNNTQKKYVYKIIQKLVNTKMNIQSLDT